MKNLRRFDATRRSILRGVGLLGMAAVATSARGNDASEKARSAPLSLILTFSDGKSLSFDQTKATDLGDYVGAFVQQKCLRQRSAPWTVFFRPDVNGLRHEIVVEYGTEYSFSAEAAPKPLDGAAPAHVSSPYKATISGGALSAPVTVAVPKHFWGARWRWQSAPRPIIRNLADLVARRAVPPYSRAALYNNPRPADRSVSWTGPMSLGGLSSAMGSAGDRPELGFITEPQACFLFTGDTAAEETMRSHAEAAGTIAMHVRDGASGAPLDVQKFPYLALQHALLPERYQIPKPAPPLSDREWMETELSHFPSLGFVPWLLTDDPFFLEEEQFVANYGTIESNYFQRNEKLPGLAIADTRGFAWGLRDLFRMAAFTPAEVPSWLASRSYWRTCVDDNLTYSKKYVASSAPECKIFHLIIETGYISVFMIDYLQIVLGWAGWSQYFPEWAPVVTYVAGSRLALIADPKAGPGWDRRLPAPYNMPLVGAIEGAKASIHSTPYPTYAPPESLNATVPQSWAELWANFVTWFNAQPKAVPLDPRSWPADALSPAQRHGYLEEARAAVAALALAGVREAAAAHRWLEPQMLHVFQADGASSLYKWAIWPE